MREGVKVPPRRPDFDTRASQGIPQIVVLGGPIGLRLGGCFRVPFMHAF